MWQRPPIECVQPGIWSKDIEDYPNTEEHKESHSELYEFNHNGYRCWVGRNFTYCWCGYVDVPKEHPDYGSMYDTLPIDVHGGLSFSQDGKFGFDCCKGQDINPKIIIGGQVMPDIQFAGATYKDYDFAINEVKKLADQLKVREY